MGCLFRRGNNSFIINVRTQPILSHKKRSSTYLPSEVYIHRRMKYIFNRTCSIYSFLRGMCWLGVDIYFFHKRYGMKSSGFRDCFCLFPKSSLLFCQMVRYSPHQFRTMSSKANLEINLSKTVSHNNDFYVFFLTCFLDYDKLYRNKIEIYLHYKV